MMRTRKEQENIDAFRLRCTNYLDALGIAALRSYGRFVGVARATTLKKKDLIDAIIDIFTGDLPPVERSKRGAPVRDDRVDSRVIQEINAYQYLYLSQVPGALYSKEKDEVYADMNWDTVKDVIKQRGAPILEVRGQTDEEKINGEKKVFCGQLQTIGEVSLLLPLNCIDSEEKVVLSVDFIRSYGLMEGDIVTCYARRGKTVFIATEILTINGAVASEFCRNRFDSANVCYPHHRIRVYNKNKYNSTENKFIDWLVPFGKGQRGLIVSAPKSGKTRLLYKIVDASKACNKNLQVLVLLIDQAPEIIGEFRKITDKNDLLYTTYEDDPERQIFVAEYLLKRAKRQVESGKDVLLIVDSFNALARAYNETEQSSGGKVLAGGVESKTIHFLKKYLGSARCLEKEGSLTILGGVSLNTGNPADELIASELSTSSNLEIRLNDNLAYKRIFPALDLTKVQVKQAERLFNLQEEELDRYLREVYLIKNSPVTLLQTISEADGYEKFYKEISSTK